MKLIKYNEFDGFKKTFQTKNKIIQIYKIDSKKMDYMKNCYYEIIKNDLFNQKINIIKILKIRKIFEYYILESELIKKPILINNINIFDEILISLSNISTNLEFPFLEQKEFFIDNFNLVLKSFYTEPLIISHDKLIDNVIFNKKYYIMDIDSLIVIPKRFLFGFLLINRIFLLKDQDNYNVFDFLRDIEIKLKISVNKQDLIDFLLFYLWLICDESGDWYYKILKIYKGLI